MPLKSLVIIPTYQEAENILPLVGGIFEAAPDTDILFVDDNSTDGTQNLIRQMSAAHPGRVHLLARPGKMGLGTAYVAGFHWGLEHGYDLLVEMDADLSHRPEDLATILARLRNKAPVVVGSRYISGGGTRNWGVGRKILSRFGSFYARTILRMNVRDLTGGFNGWHADVIRRIGPANIRSEGYTFQIELKFRASLAGFRIVEEAILFVERRAGYSKMSGRIVVEAMLRVWLLAMSRRRILAALNPAVRQQTEADAGQRVLR